MGTPDNKYHIDSDGNVFRVNDDGSFTSMGNVEDPKPAQAPYPSGGYGMPPSGGYGTPPPGGPAPKKSHTVLWIIIGAILLVGIFVAVALLLRPGYGGNPVAADSESAVYAVPIDEEESIASKKDIIQDKNDDTSDIERQRLPDETSSQDNSDYRMEEYVFSNTVGEFIVLFPQTRVYLSSRHKSAIDNQLLGSGIDLNTDLHVVGFVSSWTGTEESNRADCMHRIDAVRRYLVSRGVPEDNITVELNFDHPEFDDWYRDHMASVAVMINN